MSALKQAILVLAFVQSTFTYDTSRCEPCNQSCCGNLPCCKGDMVKGGCGCCYVCAKVFNETCGDARFYIGECDKGLLCNFPEGNKDIGLCGCSTTPCDNYCDYGYVKNRYGCDTCVCKPPELICKSPYSCNCALGVYFYFDENGCQRCGCNPRPVKSICKLSKVVGSCDGYYPRWWHNYQTGKCEKFIYGGCEANENNFPSKDDCEETCPERDKDICKLPKGRKFCFDFFRSWRYNYETGKCERIDIFGCGNANYFPSRDACVKACPEREQNICELPRDTGTCHGIFQRAWHNYETGRCERFLYTGCGGNANNFPSRIDCEKACPRKDCGRPSCDLFCPLGFKLDVNNCPLCECNECPTTQVQCPVSPCSTAPKVCAGHPQARCINNYCGGCKALWFVGQLQVKCVCKPQQCDVICPLGYQTGDDGCPLCKCKCCDPNRGCRAYPCLFAKCRLFPNATCVEEFCTSSCGTPHWFKGTIEVNCECSRLSCEPCEFGYVVDDEGCETCQCVPDLTNINACPCMHM